MNRLFLIVCLMGLLPVSVFAQISQHSIQIRISDPQSGFGIYVDEQITPMGSFVDQGCIQFSKELFPGAPPDQSLAANEYYTSPCLGVYFEPFLVERGDYFSISTIDEGQFERIGERIILPNRFYLAFTGVLYPVPEETREHFGWVEISQEDGRPTIIDQAMAYKSPGIVIGSTSTEPIPEDIELSIHRAVVLEFQTKADETYQFYSSPDAIDWIKEGDTFIGTGEIIEKFFKTNRSGVFYRLEQIP